jgi:hypothetical protein
VVQVVQQLLPIVKGCSKDGGDVETSGSGALEGALQDAKEVLGAVYGKSHTAQFAEEALPATAGGKFLL